MAVTPEWRFHRGSKSSALTKAPAGLCWTPRASGEASAAAEAAEAAAAAAVAVEASRPHSQARRTGAREHVAGEPPRIGRLGGNGGEAMS